MGGIIMGALGGLGQGMQQTGQALNQSALQDQQLAGQKDLMQLQNDLALQKEQAVLDMKSAAAQRERQNMADSIAQAQQGVINGRVQQTYGDYDAAAAGTPNSGTPLTPDQQAVIQQAAPMVADEKAATLAQLAADPHTYITAAMSKGYIDPAKVAELAMQEDAMKRQEDAQDALFEHQDQAQQRSQDFQANENAKQREATRQNIQMTRMLDPDTIESNAQAIATGKLPAITGNGLRSPSGAAIMARVMQINPAYSGADYGTSAKAEKDFATGKQGNSVRSFNVALSHLDTLAKAADALNNGNMQVFNKIGNMVSSQTGNPAPANFDAVKHIVGDEIVKAITGSGGALGDRKAAADTLAAANSPQQLAGVINQYKELMVGQINGLRDQYKAATGRDDFDSKYLSEAARTVAHAGAGGPQLVPNPVAPPASGVLTYDPKTGTFH